MELNGWKEIADFLDKSVPTTINMAKHQRMPVTLLLGTPYTTSENLEKWKADRLTTNPYWQEEEVKDNLSLLKYIQGLLSKPKENVEIFFSFKSKMLTAKVRIQKRRKSFVFSRSFSESEIFFPQEELISKTIEEAVKIFKQEDDWNV